MILVRKFVEIRRFDEFVGAPRDVCHDEIACWTRGRQDGTCGWPDGLNLDRWVARWRDGLDFGQFAADAKFFL